MSFFANRFAGRSAIVTGGASGLGLRTAMRIVREGGRVSLWDINPTALAEASKIVGAQHVAVLDIADPQAVSIAAKTTGESLGKIDILIASAGITGATCPLHEFPVENWQRVIDVNLNGLFYCCREIVPLLVRNGYGRIVNVASSLPSDFVRPITPAFEAEYAEAFGLPSLPATEATLTIRP